LPFPLPPLPLPLGNLPLDRFPTRPLGLERRLARRRRARVQRPLLVGLLAHKLVVGAHALAPREAGRLLLADRPRGVAQPPRLVRRRRLLRLLLAQLLLVLREPGGRVEGR